MQMHFSFQDDKKFLFVSVGASVIRTASRLHESVNHFNYITLHTKIKRMPECRHECRHEKTNISTN